MKRILIALGILVAALILFAAGYFVVMKHEMKKMHTVETGQITDHIYALKDSYVNAYVKGSPDSGYILVDAGNDPEAIQQGLAALNIDASKIRAIFLTYSDGDHVDAIPAFHDAEIYLSRQEE